MNRLQDGHFIDLVAQSISNDSTIKACAHAVDAPLLSTTLATPNLLLFARLFHTAGYASANNLFPALTRIIDVAGGLKPLNTVELEQLAWQLHVDFRETASDDVTLAKMVVDSIPWHRIKGTPASLKKAFSLFGYSAEIEEDGVGDYWATYQLGLPSVATLDEVKKITQIAYETHPARCSLFRIYTEVWDVRPAIYDDGFYDVHSYDIYSGVPVPGLPDGGDVVVSFGRITSSSIDHSILTAMYAGWERMRGTIARLDDELLYDVASYDFTIEMSSGFQRSRLRSIVYGQPIYASYSWEGAWDDRKWQDLIAIGYVREDFTFSGTRTSAIEATYDYNIYDDLNCHYGQPLFELTDNPAQYDDSFYDSHDTENYIYRVDILHENTTALLSERYLPENTTAYTNFTRSRSRSVLSQNLLPPVPVWKGAWQGTWQAYGAQTTLIQE